MRQQIDQIRQAANGDRALHLIREVSTFHRIQASTGYRAAAEHVAKRLKHDGLEVKIRQYPADGKSWSLVQKMFLEWDIQDATLWLAGTGECLADFKANNLSVIQRSHPADFRNQPVDIVLLDRGDQPEAYKGLDLKGKLIFVRDHFQGFMDWAIKEGGALGFITDYIRDMEGIRVRFENGRAVEVSAEKGEDTLKKLLDTDEGAAHLGELALVAASAPVAQTGTLFFNTLFDENAASHIALGRCYPTNVQGGADPEALKAAGGNDSLIHVDWMIGTPGTDVDGVTASGEREPLMRGGEWVI